MPAQSSKLLRKRSPLVKSMQWFVSNDDCELAYQDHGNEDDEPLILLHGFTGSSEVFQRIVPTLKKDWRVIIPDLRGHGKNPKVKHGYHVSRLAMDLKNLIDHLDLSGRANCIGASLGCAVIWSYCELFGAGIFRNLIFVDQAPLQNYAADWGPEYGNKSCNSAATLADLQATLRENPDKVYRGTIAACLGYRSHPAPNDSISNAEADDDEIFFLVIARQGDAEWFGKLMADHTALDWRASIRHNLSWSDERPSPNVYVVASERSGCFPPAGPLTVVDLVRDDKTSTTDLSHSSGVSIDWGGHWCYWEAPDRFCSVVANFLYET